MITPAQIRGARAMLRLSVARLAEAAGVGTSTLKRIEAADDVPNANVRTLARIREALERMGCDFPDPQTVRFVPGRGEPPRSPRRRTT